MTIVYPSDIPNDCLAVLIEYVRGGVKIRFGFDGNPPTWKDVIITDYWRIKLINEELTDENEWIRFEGSGSPIRQYSRVHLPYQGETLHV